MFLAVSTTDYAKAGAQKARDNPCMILTHAGSFAFISTFHTKNTTSLQGHAGSSALHSGRMLERSSELIYSIY